MDTITTSVHDEECDVAKLEIVESSAWVQRIIVCIAVVSVVPSDAFWYGGTSFPSTM